MELFLCLGKGRELMPELKKAPGTRIRKRKLCHALDCSNTLSSRGEVSWIVSITYWYLKKKVRCEVYNSSDESMFIPGTCLVSGLLIAISTYSISGYLSSSGLWSNVYHMPEYELLMWILIPWYELLVKTIKKNKSIQLIQFSS